MERVKNEIRRILLFAPVPLKEDLHCILGNVVQPNLNDHNSYKLKIIKCRMLIFSEPQIIASPVPGMECQIHMVMSKDYYKSEQLLHHLEKIGIRAGRNVQVTNSIYEACLRYTILARIAPLWNQIGSYLARGRDFLSMKAPLHAITFDVLMTGKELSMIIWPYRLMMYQVSLEELIEGTKENISLDSEVEIDGGKWVYVLPSLNKAQVLSISRKFQKSSAFTTYKQLKRHWKNNYGYRLPEEEDCPFYVTVSFGQYRPKLGPNGWSGNVYVYPGMCVCQCPPVILRCRDQTEPLQSFLKELSIRMPQICGIPFAGDQVELGYAVPKLYDSSSDGSACEKKYNLNEFTASHKILEGIFHVPVENPRFLPQSTYPSEELFSTANSAASVFEWNLKHISPSHVKSKDESGSLNNMRKDQKATVIVSDKPSMNEKIRHVPVFKSKTKPNTYGAGSSNRQSEKTITNRNTNTILSDSQDRANLDVRNTKKEAINRKENVVAKSNQANILNFKVLKQKIDDNGSRSATFISSKDKSQYLLKGPQNILPKLLGHGNMACSEITIGKMSTGNYTKAAFPHNVNNQDSPEKCGIDSTTILNKVKSNVKAQPLSSEKKKCKPASSDNAHYFTMEFGLWDDDKGTKNINGQSESLMNLKGMLSNSPMASSGSIEHFKRAITDGIYLEDQSKLPSSLGNTEEKCESNLLKKNTTSRGRPAVQVGVDVETLAKEGMLSKANTTTLICWLRSRGVTCRVKDKKSDLINSVEMFLGLNQKNNTPLP
ncbi:uncharacterized protein C18orf63-like [Ischnura elegans]|uniref:uncharacterized protein C18orf63-like n=1 Tax=Ischnura elegans TaxID=197161 RepID=UPI001ED879B4|nr:uncharacterized protein C18orf63-like [Ischnura elegans]